MQERQRVNIGIVGSGFIAETRARSYPSVTGYDVRLVAVASRGQERARAYAQRFGVPDVLDNFEALLDRPDSIGLARNQELGKVQELRLLLRWQGLTELGYLFWYVHTLAWIPTSLKVPKFLGNRRLKVQKKT